MLQTPGADNTIILRNYDFNADSKANRDGRTSRSVGIKYYLINEIVAEKVAKMRIF